MEPACYRHGGPKGPHSRCKGGRSVFCVNRIYNTRSVMKIKSLRLCVFARQHSFEQPFVKPKHRLTPHLPLTTYHLRLTTYDLPLTTYHLRLTTYHHIPALQAGNGKMEPACYRHGGPKGPHSRCKGGRSVFCVNRIYNTHSVMKIKSLRLCATTLF